MTDLTDRVRAAREQQKQPGTAVSTLDAKKTANRRALEAMIDEFGKVLPDEIPAPMYVRAALNCVQKTPALLDCTPQSFLGALMTCAQLGLMPGTTEVAFVPMGKTCTLIPQWQGMVKMMYNSPRVESVTAEFICEGDEWGFYPYKRPPDDFIHIPAKAGRGEVTHAYSFAWLLPSGRSRVSLLSIDDAVYIRNRFSKVWAQAEQNGKKNSFWHTDFNAAMRKSAVRRIFDWVPKSATMRMLTTDDDGSGEIVTTYVPPASIREQVQPLDAAEIEGPGEVADGEFTDDEPRTDSQGTLA
jgi:recombination protein RecT